MSGRGETTLIDCQFLANEADVGGAVYAEDFSNEMINCSFIGNHATNLGGGVYNTSQGNAFVSNCMFSGNSAGLGAGAFYQFGYAEVVNCTFSANSVPAEAACCGGYVVPAGASSQLSNCIFWGNTWGGLLGDYNHEVDADSSITFSIVPWPGNIYADPLFVDADGPDDIFGTDDDDLRLSEGSPAIDAGDNVSVPLDEFDLDDDGDTGEPLPIDIDGNPRFVDDPAVADTGIGFVGAPIVDIGAYEFQPNLCPGDTNLDGSVNVTDLLALLAAWGPNPGHVADFNDDGSVNVTDLLALLGAWGACP